MLDGLGPRWGTCDSCNAYHFDRGTIRGVDMSGLSFINVCHIPGNVLVGQLAGGELRRRPGQRRPARGDPRRLPRAAGRALADLAGLGEVVEVRRAPITHEIGDGGGTLVVEGMSAARWGPTPAPTGTTTTLRDSIFSTVPGSPAVVAVPTTTPSTCPSTG